VLFRSGDVTSVGDGAQTIAARAVSAAKLFALATSRFLGRTTAESGDVEQLTAAQLAAALTHADIGSRTAADSHPDSAITPPYTAAGQTERGTGNGTKELVPAASAFNITGAATPAVKARSYTTLTLTGAVSSLAPTGLEPGEMIAGKIVNASGYTMPDLSANAYPGWTTDDAATDGAVFILVNVAGTLKWGFSAP
jgi:hypothetical protein